MLSYLPAWVALGRKIALSSLAAVGCFYLLRLAQAGDESIALVMFAAALLCLMISFYPTTRRQSTKDSPIAVSTPMSIQILRTDAQVDRLRAKSDEFLRTHVREALCRITVPALGIQCFHVQDVGATDIFGRSFLLESGEFKFRMWVGVNVHRLFVIYHLARRPEELGFSERVAKIFQFTVGGAQAVGFKANYEDAVIDGEAILSIWLTTMTQPDLLDNHAEKLFWAQDVAMMTESYLRTAVRNNLTITTRCSPGPL